MKKSKRQQKQRGRRRSVNLNLILWLSFLLFAVVLILFFTLVQNYQLNRRYTEQIRHNFEEAAQELKESLTDGRPLPELNRILFSVMNEYNVSVYLFSEDGEIVYPDLPEGEQGQSYQMIVMAVKDRFQSFIEEAKEEGKEIDITEIQAEIGAEETEGYSIVVRFDGKLHYVYLSSSLELLHRLSAETLWYSLITALFAVALSFVISGFVSMHITKPVTEVAERAKELARGNYEVRFEGGYFCTELNELSESFNYASAQISKTDRMQKELIANVSHDFKTPLTMIKAYAAMIDEISGGDPEKRAKHVKIIMDEADRLAALVGDVLDLSRLQAGSDENDRTVFNLTEDVYLVTGRFGYLTETQGYTIETEIDEDVYTFAGKARTEQVLYNLIGNAVNYTGEDKKVVVRLKRREGCSRFEVQDSGKGIPPEEIDTIWERYYRSSELHKRPVQGTGLGLSIVKSVLLKYDIPFGVESEEGKGSTFWVDFPVPPDEKK